MTKITAQLIIGISRGKNGRQAMGLMTISIKNNKPAILATNDSVAIGCV